MLVRRSSSTAPKPSKSRRLSAAKQRTLYADYPAV
jgi:hypothetical protein